MAVTLCPYHFTRSIFIPPASTYAWQGGSSGTIFAWDRRWQKEPIFLSGVGTGGEVVANSVCESEVWEIRCDPYVQSQGTGNVSSSAVLPVISCSEDGILAVVKEGEEPVELMAEPCAINSFDINSHNPSEVTCSLEWESISYHVEAVASFEIQSEPKTPRAFEIAVFLWVQSILSRLWHSC